MKMVIEDDNINIQNQILNPETIILQTSFYSNDWSVCEGIITPYEYIRVS